MDAATTGSDALEFGMANYPCMDGFALPNGDEWFQLACDDTSGGSGAAFPSSPVWPECVVPECSYPIPAGMRTSTGLSSGNDKLEQGEMRAIQCQLNSQVIDGHGYEAMVECSTSGLQPDPATLSCVLPPACTMTVPDPPLTSKLSKVSGSMSKEYDEITFKCEEGHTLVGTSDPKDLNDDGHLVVTCDNSVSLFSFPQCKPLCSDYPTPTFTSGLIAVDATDKVAPGQYGLFRCVEDDEIPDLDNNPFMAQFGLLCQPDGKFEAPTWPNCRKIVSCPFPPVPPAASALTRADQDIDIREFESASYECSDGFHMAQPYPPGFNVNGEKINLK